MGNICNYLRDKLVDHILGVAAYTPVATLYLALSTADPTELGTGLTEPATANNYARKAITFDASVSGEIAQTAKVTFDEVETGSWGDISHWAVCDNSARATGNVLARGAFGESKTGSIGRVASVNAAEVTVSISGEVSYYCANKCLDFAFRNQAFSQPTIYTAVCDADIEPHYSGSDISEPSDGYSRVAHAAWNAAVSGEASNDGDIEIGPATSSWGAQDATALVDAETAGNLLLFDNAFSETVGEDDGIRFPDGTYSVALT